MYHRLCQLPRVTVANNALAEVFKKEEAQLELITVRFTVSSSHSSVRTVSSPVLQLSLMRQHSG